MKTLAVHSSPKGKAGNTALVLDPFLKGMEEGGAEVELLYTKKLDINPCLGCMSCFMKTPGICVQDDDMKMVLSKLREADVWVFSMPLYWSGVPGPMKNLIDRMTPFSDTFLEIKDGHSAHPLREDVKRGKFALVSSCGFWELDNFDSLVDYFRVFCEHTEREFSGALLRPHAGPLPIMKEAGKADDIFEAAKSAGKQLATEGDVSQDTLSSVSRPLMPLEVFIQAINQRFKQALETAQGSD